MTIKKMSDHMIYRDASLTKRILHEDKNALSFLLNLRPGQSIPRHGHEDSTLIIAVLRGEGSVQVNDEVIRAVEGDFLTLGGQDELAIPEVFQDFTLFVTLTPNPSNAMYAKEV